MPDWRFDYCTVPESGQDAFLFAAIAMLVACVFAGKLSAVWVLLLGECPQRCIIHVYIITPSWPCTSRRLIYPPDTKPCRRWPGRAQLLGEPAAGQQQRGHLAGHHTTRFVLLPPLLVDSAMRLDYYLVKKVWVGGSGSGADFAFLHPITLGVSCACTSRDGYERQLRSYCHVRSRPRH